MKWTAADQRALDNLMQRKEEFENRYRKVLEDLVQTKIHREEYEGCSYEDIIAALIEHADAFRDALSAFDSGERPAQAQ